MAESVSNMLDKTARSVFVGNIPYDVTEEKLKEIFSEVGPVLSFKIVFDRESGKPKGYGFCEYQDIDTAQSAIRNLNGYEVSGRVLRVDSASANDRSRDIGTIFLPSGPETIYGEGVEPAQAPEAISRAVASLPPEQMFELMKQMKLCIQNNPLEARQMLLQNPQLAYALLQALVVMKVVDPSIAVTLLQRSNAQPPVMMPAEGAVGPIGGIGMMPMVGPGPMGAGLVRSGPLPGLQAPGPMGVPSQQFGQRPPLLQVEGPWPGPPRMAMPGPPAAPIQDVDFRNVPRDMDMRGGPPVRGVQPPGGPSGDVDARFGRDARAVPAGVPAPGRDPRAAAAASRGVPAPQPVAPPVPNLGVPAGTDQEKTALIMQVLQLSDEQIALLPPEQRQSIMVLKEQIARSAPR